MQHLKTIAFSGILLVILLTLLFRGISTKAASAGSCSWQVISSPNVAATDNYLNGVAAVSATNAWAVGYTSSTGGSSGQTLTEHWDGTQWSIVSTPHVQSSTFSGVAVIPGTSRIWAVGSHGSQTLIERWNGTQWSVVPSPNVGSYASLLNAVTALSQNNAWAVGAYYDPKQHGYQTLIEHWDGTHWSIVPNVNPGLLSSVVAISTRNVWAVGYFYTNSIMAWRTQTEHWNGTQWSLVSSPSVASYNSFLFSVSPVHGTSELWAVGYYNTIRAFQTLTEHWDGTQWRIVSSPNIGVADNSLSGVVAVSANNVWAVGNQGRTDILTVHTLTEQWDGTQWNIVAAPQKANLDAVARIPGTNKIWTVGEYSPTATSTQTVIEVYC